MHNLLEASMTKKLRGSLLDQNHLIKTQHCNVDQCIDLFCCSSVKKTQHPDKQVALPQIQVQVPQVSVALKVEEEGLKVEIEV